MFAARGISNVDDYLESAFAAVESSSVETVMGSSWQAMLSAISENTLDTGDLTTVRENALWVCEIKAQHNTTNSSSFPQELRGLRTRMDEYRGLHRASGQPVKAAYCIVRDPRKGGKGYDEVREYRSGELARENRDLDGFKYRYISGKQFWKWLTGFESEVALLMPLSEIQDELGNQVQRARKHAKSQIREILYRELEKKNLGTTIDDVVLLRDLYL